jgi:hypothetical protein
MVLTGSVVSRISKKIWDGIRFYQSLEYENEEGVQKFLQKENVFSPESIDLRAGQFLYTLSTPEAHTEFLQRALETAKTSIFLFSPFIRLQKLQQVFTQKNLRKVARNNARVILITLPSPCDSREEQQEIFTALQGFKEGYGNFSYITYPHFHAKTLIVDQMICEGSYNWLSAVKHIDHDANNFEMSIALQGTSADSLLQSFWATSLGTRVIEHTRPAATSSVKISKKRSLVQGVEESVVQIDTVVVEEKRKRKESSSSIPESFDSLIRIFSGESFGKQGYCVRFQDRKYLKNLQKSILYFATSQQAKEAAYLHYQNR